jgi:hypothetical protein
VSYAKVNLNTTYQQEIKTITPTFDSSQTVAFTVTFSAADATYYYKPQAVAAYILNGDGA